MLENPDIDWTRTANECVVAVYSYTRIAGELNILAGGSACFISPTQLVTSLAAISLDKNTAALRDGRRLSIIYPDHCTTAAVEVLEIDLQDSLVRLALKRAGPKSISTPSIAKTMSGAECAVTMLSFDWANNSGIIRHTGVWSSIVHSLEHRTYGFTLDESTGLWLGCIGAPVFDSQTKQLLSISQGYLDADGLKIIGTPLGNVQRLVANC